MSPDPRRGIVTLFDWSTGSTDSGSFQETSPSGVVHNRITSAVNHRLPLSLRETQFVYRDSPVSRKPSKNEHRKPRPIIKQENTSPMIITNTLNSSIKTAAFSQFVDGRAITLMSLNKDSVSSSRKRVTFSDSMCTSGSKSGASTDSESEVNLDESISAVSFPGVHLDSIHPNEGSTDAHTLVRRRSYKSVFPPIVNSPRGTRDSPRKTHRATVIDIYLPTTGIDGSETSSTSPDDLSNTRDGNGSMNGTMFRPMFTRRSVKWSRSLDASMSSTSSEEGVAPMTSSPHDSPKRPLGEIRRTTNTTVHVNNMTLP